MRKRTNQIIVRLSDQEMLLLRRKLKANGMTMTGYFRALIVSGEIKTLPPELMQDIQRQVRGVGRNINQMAKLAHISGKVSMGTLYQISDAQEKLEQQVERLAQWRF
ncbi:MAG: plasmid mobilization protein [Butyricicoccus sp.]